MLESDLLLEEEDAAEFVDLVQQMKTPRTTERRQWCAYLRNLCKPYFNPQEPQKTGAFVVQYFQTINECIC